MSISVAFLDRMWLKENHISPTEVFYVGFNAVKEEREKIIGFTHSRVDASGFPVYSGAQDITNQNGARDNTEDAQR